jgi:hypothetical protein
MGQDEIAPSFHTMRTGDVDFSGCIPPRAIRNAVLLSCVAWAGLIAIGIALHSVL